MAREKKAKRTDYTVIDAVSVYSIKAKKTNQGKAPRIGTRVTYSDGETQTLLTPAGKGTKYANELKHNRRVTNEGLVKTDENGNELKLSKAQRSFRSGYLQAQKDASKAYNSREAKKAAKAEERAQKKEAKAQAKAAKHGDSRGEQLGIERFLQ